MPQFHFENVSLVLVEANRDIRSTIRTSLEHEGFGQVRDTHRLDRAQGWVLEAAPDLLIADSDYLDACRMFRGIRHQELGADPFVPIIAVSTAGMPPRIRRAIDSGADQILVKPVTIEHLLERVLRLIRSRKPFVVTCDYIGPDRRREPRPGPSAPLIEVPNALRTKATRSADPITLRRDIQRAIAEINQRKMERNAFQIAWLVERIVDLAATPERAAHLNRLLDSAEDLARRLAGTAQDHVSGLCRSLIQVTAKLVRDGAAADARDIKVLPHLAAAIHAAFPDNGATAVIAREITDTVSRLTAD
ncbi:MAG TPA: response regulator [Alphaproteobacteria bacterium]|nr:response regulator [Alphaproteobacteria bacterium]